MKAWVIKLNRSGYSLGFSISKWPIMDLYRTQKKALEDACKGDEIVPVEIKEITGTRRRKVK